MEIPFAGLHRRCARELAGQRRRRLGSAGHLHQRLLPRRRQPSGGGRAYRRVSRAVDRAGPNGGSCPAREVSRRPHKTYCPSTHCPRRAQCVRSRLGEDIVVGCPRSLVPGRVGRGNDGQRWTEPENERVGSGTWSWRARAAAATSTSSTRNAATMVRPERVCVFSAKPLSGIDGTHQPPWPQHARGGAVLRQD